MPIYLLTWKPEPSDWDSLEYEVRQFRGQGRLRLRWSAGVNQHIAKGDRVFLLRQGPRRAGIFGAGRVLRGSYRGRHWKRGRKGTAIWIDIRMDSLLDPEQERVLRRDELGFGPPGLWNSRSSGVTIPSDTAAELEQRWSVHLKRLNRRGTIFSEEGLDVPGFPEGAKERILVNRYERDRRNRDACIAIHGCKCSICDFEFARTYGELGRNFIHVHHVLGLASRTGRIRRPNPRRDLRPVCPNCHEMIHIGGNNRSISELRRIVRSKRARRRQERDR
jgi:5-methylcytosine-specific restriction enzyme A